MKFLCAVYFEENPFQRLSADQQAQLKRDSLQTATFSVVAQGLGPAELSVVLGSGGLSGWISGPRAGCEFGDV